MENKINKKRHMDQKRLYKQCWTKRYIITTVNSCQPHLVTHMHAFNTGALNLFTQLIQRCNVILLGGSLPIMYFEKSILYIKEEQCKDEEDQAKTSSGIEPSQTSPCTIIKIKKILNKNKGAPSKAAHNYKVLRQNERKIKQTYRSAQKQDCVHN